MILTDGDLYMALADQGLEISGMTPDQVQPNSVDLKLGDTLKEFGEPRLRNPLPYSFEPVHVIDPEDPETFPEMTVRKFSREQPYALLPGGFVLATTDEWVTMPRDLCGFIDGRSSYGRLGLFIENAGLIDSGFSGKITLELFNANRYAILLRPGMRICQMPIFRCSSPAVKPYGLKRSKYQYQSSVQESRVHLDAQG